MRIVLITGSLCVALFARVAMAGEWTQVSKDDFSTIYMDPASIKTLPDGVVTLDALTDYDPASPQATEFRLSEKGLSEIESVRLDCVNKKYGSLGGAWRDGHMGAGKIGKTYPPKDSWSKVPGFYEGLFAKVCAKQ